MIAFTLSKTPDPLTYPKFLIHFFMLKNITQKNLNSIKKGRALHSDLPQEDDGELGILMSIMNYLTSAAVSRAIVSSSSVGITHTFTGESALDITASVPRTPALTSLSISTPMNPSVLHTS